MKNLATRNQSIWIDNDNYLDLRSMVASGRELKFDLRRLMTALAAKQTHK